MDYGCIFTHECNYLKWSSGSRSRSYFDPRAPLVACPVAMTPLPTFGSYLLLVEDAVADDDFVSTAASLSDSAE